MKLFALVLLFAQLAAPLPKFNRMEWRHWIDADKDCQDTRNEVLIRESHVPVTFYPNTQKPGKGCIVRAGEWLDPYTGKTFTAPFALDVDHVVPLDYAHKHGGALWSAEKKRDFANDLDAREHLQAVDKSANRSKGGKGPAEWQPRREDWCGYALAWDLILAKWELTPSAADVEMLDTMRGTCTTVGWTIIVGTERVTGGNTLPEQDHDRVFSLLDPVVAGREDRDGRRRCARVDPQYWAACYLSRPAGRDDHDGLPDRQR